MLTLNLNDPAKSDIQYERMTFPDGQPHIKLPYYSQPHEKVNVVARITNPTQLFEVMLVSDILKDVPQLDLWITYLMGARMDRRIDDQQPDTLLVVQDALETTYFDTIHILDPHSDKSLYSGVSTLKYEVWDKDWFMDPIIEEGKEPVYLDWQMDNKNTKLALVAPDAGSTKKVRYFADKHGLPMVQCLKKRDSKTGKLSGFEIANWSYHLRYPLKDTYCLIPDDICDGGGTFAGIAKLLRDAGAPWVGLAVTHGIFSKGIAIEGIDNIWTTDSYQNFEGSFWDRFVVRPVPTPES